MTFISPEWLLLIPAIILLGTVIRRLSLFRPVRILCILLISLILAKPRYETIDPHLDLWVLIDQSESTEDLILKGLPEWKQILEQSKPSNEDKIIYVDYASDVSIQEPNSERAKYNGNRKLTKTQLALEDILARRSENRPSRIVIFTDGYSTEPIYEVANKLSAEGIAVDFRLVREEKYNDYQIAKVNLPTQTQVGEPFILSVTVKGHKDATIPVSIYRNQKKIQQTEVTLLGGIGKIQFTTRIEQAGSYLYSAKITPDEDRHSGNNQAEKWIQVTGGPRVLLVSNYDNDPLAQVLRSQNYAVDLIPDSENLSVGQLSGAKSVIFNNIPAHEVPIDFLKALNFFVNEQGGGFMMLGGRRSFAAGGYYRSPIDPILPVSMELKNDHRKLSVAMSIVMDRSGSMSTSVKNPKGGLISKMQLANNGAAEAINLLGTMDQVAIYAVDTQPSTVLSLQTISGNKAALMLKARKVISAGGGIYVYAGLKKAWDDLKKSALSTKHIILFSDATDSEKPEAYKGLLAEMQADNTTVSVIGLGNKKDPDAKLLEDIAKRGGGRIFFTDSPIDLPRIFAQETVTLARSAFLTNPVETLVTGSWDEISNEPIEFLPQVDAYNLAYARPEATTSLLTKDEYVAPLICHWRRGMGRAAAVTFPVGGSYSELIRKWDQYGNFLQTLVNWLNGDRFPPGLTMRHKLEGTKLTVDLLYDTSEQGQNWSREFAINPPKIKLQEDGGGSYDLNWKRIAPGHYSLSKNLEEGVLVKGAIQAGNYALPFGPLMAGTNSEWAFDPDRISELKALSIQTGGNELSDISKAWIRPEISKQKSLVPIFCVLLLLALLADALITRIGFTFKLPQFKASNEHQPDSPPIPRSRRFNPIATRMGVNKNRKSVSDQIPLAEQKEDFTEPPPEPDKVKSISRSERFARAKKRK